jgi:GT2 family glycosyltransferase
MLTASARVIAVVVTHNRKELLLSCLEALAQQRSPVAGAVVVDTASTDGTVDALRGADVTARLPIRLLRLARNGGGAEGFHYGVAAALERPSDWLWLMDDDCEPRPDTLEQLLRSRRAADPSTALLAPVVVAADERVLPLNRGRVRARWALAPLVALREDEHVGGECEIGFCTFVGPLIRTEAARRAGLPMREMFIRNDDVEYCLRLAGPGRMWLVSASMIVHHDPTPFVRADSLRARLREFRSPPPLAGEWKHLYALRNLVFAARRHGIMGAAQATSFAAIQVIRRLLVSERRLRGSVLAAAYAYDGMRGRFRNVPPRTWAEIVVARQPFRELDTRALHYDHDVREGDEELA